MPLQINRDEFITCAITGSGGTQGKSPHIPRTAEKLSIGIPWGASDDLNTLMAMVNNVPPDWQFPAFSVSRNEMP